MFPLLHDRRWLDSVQHSPSLNVPGPLGALRLGCLSCGTPGPILRKQRS